MDKQKPILLSGLPRSGTTWTSKVLQQDPNAFFLMEPDNEHLNLRAMFLKEGLHRYPYLRKKDKSPLYHKLWEDIFNNHSHPEVFPEKFTLDIYQLEKVIGKKCGEVHRSFFRYSEDSFKGKTLKREIDIPKKPKGKRLIVKSVYDLLALDWLDHHFDVVPVVIIRHPANIISSYLKLKFPDSYRNIYHQERLVKDYFKKTMPKINRLSDNVEKMTAQIGGAYYVLEKQLKKHRNWILIRHEDLCEDPIKQFKILYKKIGLKWTEEVKQFIRDSNKPGKGYRTNRVAASEIDKYKSLLTAEQVEKIQRVYPIFGSPFYKKI